jgi:hypothetical protein
MSAEARLRETVDAAVAAAVEPLRAELKDVSARLAAVEGSGGTSGAETRRRTTRGRTAARTDASDAGQTQPSASETKTSGNTPAAKDGNAATTKGDA